MAKAIGRFRPFLLPSLAAFVAVGGVVVFVAQPPEPESEPAPIPVLVREVHISSRPMHVSVSGEVEAERSVDVGFQVGGVVARVGPEEGDAVNAGQMLAELDTLEYRLQLELARATVDQAEDAFRRAQQLYELESLPPADLAKAETSLRQARAQEALARKRLADTRLVAPLGGVVARRAINPREHAAPGVPVFTIVALDPVQVRVGVPEGEIGRVRVGQHAAITFPSLPGASFEGRVRLVGVTADPVSRTYSVRIATPNPDGVLRPGMIAEVRIREDAMVRTLSVPGEAVIRTPQGSTLVYVYHPEEGRVYGRRVQVGSLYGREVEITTGLDGGELVVVGGQHRVRDGARVEARTVDAPPATEGAVGR